MVFLRRLRDEYTVPDGSIPETPDCSPTVSKRKWEYTFATFKHACAAWSDYLAKGEAKPLSEKGGDESKQDES